VQGLTDRISFELQTMFPGSRIRLQAPGSIVERKYAGWIGGSILASLGAFHQVMEAVGFASLFQYQLT